MVLSDRFKYSFKVALAMVLAYGIALSMNWEKPMWAGFAVAFISLATVGKTDAHPNSRSKSVRGVYVQPRR